MNPIDPANPAHRCTSGYVCDERVDTAGNLDVLAAVDDPVAAFYRRYLAGDLEGMLTLMAGSIRLRFPSYPVLCGLAAVRPFLEFQATLFAELRFQLVDVLVRPGGAAVIWREAGTTAVGAPWGAHGVDVLQHDGRLITALEVGGSAAPLLTVLPRFGSDGSVTPRSFPTSSLTGRTS